MRSGGGQTRAGGASDLGRDFEVDSGRESVMWTKNLSHIWFSLLSGHPAGHVSSLLPLPSSIGLRAPSLSGRGLALGAPALPLAGPGPFAVRASGLATALWSSPWAPLTLFSTHHGATGFLPGGPSCQWKSRAPGGGPNKGTGHVGAEASTCTRSVVGGAGHQVLCLPRPPPPTPH